MSNGRRSRKRAGDLQLEMFVPMGTYVKLQRWSFAPAWYLRGFRRDISYILPVEPKRSGRRRKAIDEAIPL